MINKREAFKQQESMRKKQRGNEMKWFCMRLGKFIELVERTFLHHEKPDKVLHKKMKLKL